MQMYTDHLYSREEYESEKYEKLSSWEESIKERFVKLRVDEERGERSDNKAKQNLICDMEKYKRLNDETYEQYRREYIGREWKDFWNYKFVVGLQAAFYIFVAALPILIPIWLSRPSSSSSSSKIGKECYVCGTPISSGVYCYRHTYHPPENNSSSSSSKKNSSSSSSSYKYSSGSSSSKTTIKDDPYDKYWYDDPDDFAADWEDEFDSYDDAYEYWED